MWKYAFTSICWSMFCRRRHIHDRGFKQILLVTGIYTYMFNYVQTCLTTTYQAIVEVWKNSGKNHLILSSRSLWLIDHKSNSLAVSQSKTPRCTPYSFLALAIQSLCKKSWNGDPLKNECSDVGDHWFKTWWQYWWVRTLNLRLQIFSSDEISTCRQSSLWSNSPKECRAGLNWPQRVE